MSLSTLDLAFVSAGILGFRHGFDYDHIAAISDITSMEPSKRAGMQMGFVYILGHAVTLAALGGAVILFQHSLPRQIDRWAERAVGATLVLLGVYVLGSLFRKKDNGLLPRSRAAMLIGLLQWIYLEAAASLRLRTRPDAQARTGTLQSIHCFSNWCYPWARRRDSKLVAHISAGCESWRSGSRIGGIGGFPGRVDYDEPADDCLHRRHSEL